MLPLALLAPLARAATAKDQTEAIVVQWAANAKSGLGDGLFNEECIYRRAKQWPVEKVLGAAG